jgi:hypothetical protein
MHREALKLLHQLVEESKSNQSKPELNPKFKPESIVEYLKVRSRIWFSSLGAVFCLTGETRK